MAEHKSAFCKVNFNMISQLPLHSRIVNDFLQRCNPFGIHSKFWFLWFELEKKIISSELPNMVHNLSSGKNEGLNIGSFISFSTA